MELALLGWPEDGPTLRLDYRRFSYAGKFVMTNTGKAVVRETGGGESASNAVEVSDDEAAFNAGEVNGDEAVTDACEDGSGRRELDDHPAIDPAVFDDGVFAAVSFNEDRTDDGVLWIRYVTVHEDHRGRGIGPRLAAFVRERAEDREYRRVRIAVNNPFAYQALYKAGFAYTGRKTGIAELVLEYPGERDRPTYQCGLDVFRDRDLGERERSFLAAKEGAEPPAVIDPSVGRDADREDSEDADPRRDANA